MKSTKGLANILTIIVLGRCAKNTRVYRLEWYNCEYCDCFLCESMKYFSVP